MQISSYPSGNWLRRGGNVGEMVEGNYPGKIIFGVIQRAEGVIREQFSRDNYPSLLYIYLKLKLSLSTTFKSFYSTVNNYIGT